jgi:hypothetical protein
MPDSQRLVKGMLLLKLAILLDEFQLVARLPLALMALELLTSETGSGHRWAIQVAAIRSVVFSSQQVGSDDAHLTLYENCDD